MASTPLDIYQPATSTLTAVSESPPVSLSSPPTSAAVLPSSGTASPPVSSLPPFSALVPSSAAAVFSDPQSVSSAVPYRPIGFSQPPIQFPPLSDHGLRPSPAVPSYLFPNSTYEVGSSSHGGYGGSPAHSHGGYGGSSFGFTTFVSPASNPSMAALIPPPSNPFSAAPVYGFSPSPASGFVQPQVVTPVSPSFITPNVTNVVTTKLANADDYLSWRTQFEAFFDFQWVVVPA